MDLDSKKKDRLSPICMGKIIDDYEVVGLNSSRQPPQLAVQVANSCKVVINSDLPRSIASVQMLGLEDIGSTDETFRESSLPYLNWTKPRFSFFSWAIIFRIAWLFGFSTNGESIKCAKSRGKIGAEKLHHLAYENDSVLLLGHGIMNRLVAKELKNLGWIKKENTGEKYWSYKVFEFEK